MRLVRVGPPGAKRPAAVDADGVIRDLSTVTTDIDGPFLGGGLSAAADALSRDVLPPIAPDGPRFGAPIARPGKVVCIGLNYRDHAAETGQAVPTRPIVFMKDPYTVVGPDDDVLIPRGSTKTDYEVELAIVIGAQARYLDSPADAAPVVAGYAVSNDVSEREFQLELSSQWDLGKSCETFNPLGPWLVTPDEVGDAGRLALRLSVNGD